MIPVADMFANLSLRTTDFIKGTSQAVAATKQLGSELDRSFGKKANKNVESMTKNMQKLTWAARGGVKDIMRVVSGILISQAFYTTLRGIQDSIAAMHEFTKATERSQIAYGLLLNDMERGMRLTKSIEMFAATTPATMNQAKMMGETLLSLGFKAESLNKVMTSILDASVIGGGTSEVLEGLTLALGNIQAKGRLDALHIKRFIAARIPIYEILKEELDLTEKEIQRIGEMNIPAGKAIEAILRGIDKRFGGASELLGTTWDARMNQIKDNLAMISRIMYKGTYDGFKETLDSVRNYLMDLREIAEKYGTGGIFEALVPEKYQNKIRVIVSSLKGLVDAFLILHNALKPVREAFNSLIITITATVLPILAGLVNILARLLHWATTNIPGIKELTSVIGSLIIAYTAGAAILFLVGAIKALALTKAIIVLIAGLKSAMAGLIGVAAALAAIIGGPATVAIGVIVAALGYLASRSAVAAAWLDALQMRLAKLFGFNAEQLWTPDPSDFEFDPGEFSQEYMEGIADIGEAYDDALESGNAFKKFVASFDELFRVPEPEGGGGGGGGGLDDLLDKMKEINYGFDPTGPWYSPPEMPDQGTLPPFEWPIEELDWDKFLPPFPGWPMVPPFIWPPIPVFEWEPIPSLVPEFNKVFAPALDRIKDFAKDAIRQYVEAMKKFGIPIVIPAPNIAPGWSGIGDSLLQQMEKIFKGLDNAWGAVTPKLNEMGERLRKVSEQGSNAFDGVLNGLRGLSASPEWGSATHKLWDLQEGFRTAQQAVSTSVEGIKLSAQQLGNSISVEIDTTVDRVLNMGYSFGEVAIAAAASLPVIGKKMIESAKEFGQGRETISEGLRNIIEEQQLQVPTMGEVWSTTLANIQGFWDEHKVKILVVAGLTAAGAIGAFFGVPAGVGAALSGLGARAGLAFAAMIPAIDMEVLKIPQLFINQEEPLRERASSLVARITEKFPDIPLAFQNMTLLLPGILELARTGLVETASSIIETLKETFGTLTPSWEEIVNKLPEPVRAIVTGVVTEAQGLLDNMMQKLGEVKPKWQEIVDSMPQILSSIVGPMSTLASTIASNVNSALGRIRDEITGIISRLGELVSTAASAASKAASYLSQAASAAAGAARNAANAAADAAKAAAAKREANKKADPTGNPAKPGGRAMGGVITKPELSWIGEAGPEVVIPLSGKEKMRPFANLLMSQMKQSAKKSASIGRRNPVPAQSMLTQNNAPQGQQYQQHNQANIEKLVQALETKGTNHDDRPILFVGTLIADDRSLVELERKMEVIRVKENVRRGHQ